MANTSLTFWAPYSSRLFFCPGRSAWPQTAKCLLLKLGQVKTSCYHILTLTHTDTLTIHFPPLDFYSIAMNLIYSRKNNFCCVGPSHHEALDPLPTAGVRESFFLQNYNREIRLDLSMGKEHPSSHAPVLAFPSPETCCSSMEQKDLWEMTRLTQMLLHTEPPLLVTALGILAAAALL